MPGWTWLLAVLAACLVSCVDTQSTANKEFKYDPVEWNVASDFLISYHSQSPIRRMIVAYHILPGTEIRHNEQIYQFFRNLSSKGISSSFIQLPSPDQIAALRLTDENQPPVTCVIILTPNDVTSSFIRAASDAGGMSGTRVSWMYIKNSQMRPLTSGVGLRPDTTLLSIELDGAVGTANIQQWTGSNFTERVAWDGVGRRMPLELSNPPNRNLAGQQLSVAVFHDPPFVILTNVTNSRSIDPSKLSGWLIDIWLDLQKILAFNSSFYNPTRQGITRVKSSVAELESGRADVILSPFVVTVIDLDIAAFSMPIAELNFRFLLPRETAASTIDQFILPFETLLWRATALVLTLAVVILSTSYWMGRYFEFEDEGMPIFNFKESLLVLYGSLFAQGHDYIPNSLASRMIIWMCYVFGVVVSTAYGASLINKLTLGAVEPPFKTLEGMLDSAYTVIVSPDSAPYRIMMTAETGAWKEMRERKPYPVTNPSLDDSIIEVQKSYAKFTLLQSRERVLPRIQYPPENCKLTMLVTDVMSSPGQLMLSKSSPYKAALDQQLISMRGSGRLARMKERWMGLVYDDPCPRDATLPQFGMDNVLLPFMILGGSAALGLVFLSFEYAIKKWCGILLNNEKSESELEKLARTKGIRLTKGWQILQSKLPIITENLAGSAKQKANASADPKDKSKEKPKEVTFVDSKSKK